MVSIMKSVVFLMVVSLGTVCDQGQITLQAVATVKSSWWQ